MKTEELLSLYAKGERDFRKANLQDANLQDARLQDANLQDANLQCADLQYANLQGADLRYADLQDAKLQDADLQYANLHGANLHGAKLQGANLIVLQFLSYTAYIQPDITRIGCQYRPSDFWLNATREDVSTFATDAAEAFKLYGPIVRAAIQAVREAS